MDSTPGPSALLTPGGVPIAGLDGSGLAGVGTAGPEPTLADPLAPEELLGDAEAQRRYALARAVSLQTVLLAGGVAAFLALMLKLSPVLSPVFIGLVGAVLLWPLRQQKAARPLLVAGGLLLFFFLLGRLGGVLAPFIVVWILAFLLDPVVAAAERRWRIPRWAATLALTLAFVGVLVGVVFLLVPLLVEQVQTLAAKVLDLGARLPELIANARVLDAAEEAGLVDQDELAQNLSRFVQTQAGALVGQLPHTVSGITRSVGALVGLVTTVVLVPVILFYTLKDFPALRRALAGLFPRYHGSRAYLTHVGEVVGNYLRGQLTISAIAAVVVTIPLLLLDVPFALLIGILTGLLNMIPNIGAILSYVIGGLLMLAFGTWGDVAIVIGVIAGESLLEQTVLTPNIMSQQVGLHPVLVILSLFVFGAFLGLLGFFVAVPLTALLVAMYRAFRESLVLELQPTTQLIVAPDALTREAWQRPDDDVTDGDGSDTDSSDTDGTDGSDTTARAAA